MLCDKIGRIRFKTDKYKQQRKDNAIKHKEKIQAYKKEYRKKNIAKIKTLNKTYRNDNKQKFKEYGKEYRGKNPVKNKEWRKNNPEKVKIYRKTYELKYPFRKAWRSVLGNCLTRLGRKKEDKTINLLKYSAIELKNHIEKLFKTGMTWDNWGDWHIDHIKAISKFDPETPMHVVNALSNLQPLWALENIIKGNKDI